MREESVLGGVGGWGEVLGGYHTKNERNALSRSSTPSVDLFLLSANIMPSLPRLPARRVVARRAVIPRASTAPTAIVTGASPNSIGVETAKALAARGYAATLACRDPVKAAAAADQVASVTANGGSVTTEVLDLADLASVRAFAARFADASPSLDLLINNAGVMACPLGRTVDGFEMQMGTNHLGHYALTLRLLPLLLSGGGGDSSPRLHTPRVVTLASSAHQFGRLDFDDLNYDRKPYNAWRAYGASKLANVLFASELARRAPRGSLISHSVHPGVVNTELARHLIDPASSPAWQRPLFALTARFLKTPPQGAATSVYVATSEDDDVVATNGQYYADSKLKRPSADGLDLRAATRLWDLSAELTGEDGTAGGLLVGPPKVAVAV